MRHDTIAGAVRKAVCRVLIAAIYMAVFLWAILPESALAAPQCAPYAAMAKALQQRFGESPQAIGLIGESRLMQVFTAPGGSWTILVITASGRSCILAAGEGWEDLPPAPAAKPGDPA